MNQFLTGFGVIAVEATLVSGGYFFNKAGYQTASNTCYTIAALSIMLVFSTGFAFASVPDQSYYKAQRDQYGKQVFSYLMSDGTIVYRDHPNLS